jgi:hypothetical protein
MWTFCSGHFCIVPKSNLRRSFLVLSWYYYSRFLLVGWTLRTQLFPKKLPWFLYKDGHHSWKFSRSYIRTFLCPSTGSCNMTHVDRQNPANSGKFHYLRPIMAKHFVGSVTELQLILLIHLCFIVKVVFFCLFS